MKPFYKSKTLYVAVGALVLDILNQAYGTVPISDQVRVVVVTGLMIAMRFLTSDKLVG